MAAPPALSCERRDRAVAASIVGPFARTRFPQTCPELQHPGADPERQRILAGQLRDQQVDGLIVSPIDPADEFWTELAASLPVVSIGDSLTGAGAVGEVLTAGQLQNARNLAVQRAQTIEGSLNRSRIGVWLPLEEDEVFYQWRAILSRDRRR